MRRFFLPRNGPQSVHKSYTNYMAWSFVSNFFISAECVLSTHSMFAAAAAVAATTTTTVAAATGESNTNIFSLNYIGKDIIGQIGGVVWMNKYGHQADCSRRHFIRTNALIQQTSTLMECATPLLPPTLFFPIAALANVGKNITFVGFGAVNATVIQRLAIDGSNVGEIYSKLALVNTFASTAGMVAGLAIATLVPSHSVRLVCVMPVIAACRVLSYTQSMKGLL